MKYLEIIFKLNGPQSEKSDACDLLASMSGEVGFESFEETDDGLKGYIQTSLFDENALKEIVLEFPFEKTTVEYKVKEAEYKDWNDVWENEGFQPINVDEKIFIHDGRHLPDILRNDAIQIKIDAKMAFGTGTHETTRMMVSALLSYSLKNKRVLDCGCGTGILSIASIKLGAAEAVGFDIDEWSADNARHNAIINNVEAQFTPLLGDADILYNVDGLFDIEIANINRNIILSDICRYKEKMKENGLMMLSGFYVHDADVIINKAQELELKLIEQKEENGWCCLVFSAS